jgi:glycosyltransferase involved in cell wall biosynthesis
MKIAVLADFVRPFSIGGAEVVAQSLADGLARRGVDVVLVTTGPRGELRRSRPRSHLTVYRFFPANLYFHFPPGVRRGLVVRSLWWLLNLWNPSVFGTVRSILRAERPDAVIVQNYHTLSPSVFSAARSAGCPAVFTAHDHVLLCFRSVMARRGRPCRGRCPVCFLWSRWQRLFLRDVRFLFTSRFSRGLHRALLGADGPVVSNPVVPGEAAIRRLEALKRRSRHEGTVFVYLGRLTPVKGVRTLLDAFSRLRSARARLVVIGSGELGPEVDSLAKADARVSFPGKVEEREKDRLLAEGDVLVFPSECHEASPVTLVEAFSHGLPVIAADLGSLAEHVEDGRTGWLFPRQDADGLARVMDRVCDDPRGLARARARAFSRARDMAREDILGDILEGCLPAEKKADARRGPSVSSRGGRRDPKRSRIT